MWIDDFSAERRRGDTECDTYWPELSYRHARASREIATSMVPCAVSREQKAPMSGNSGTARTKMACGNSNN